MENPIVEVQCRQTPAPRLDDSQPADFANEGLHIPETATSAHSSCKSYSLASAESKVNLQSQAEIIHSVDPMLPGEGLYGTSDQYGLWVPYPTEIDTEFFEWNSDTNEGMLETQNRQALE